MAGGIVLCLLSWRAAAQTSPRRLTRPPQLLQPAEAEYPAALRRAGLTATVLLRVTLDAQGRVSGSEVLQSGGADFDRAAAEALSRFRFAPAEVDGVPAAVVIDYRYAFVLPRQVATPPAAAAMEAIAATTVDEEEVVRAVQLRADSVAVTVRSSEARQVPGTQGDALKVIENLPGVARAAFSSGQIVVWGSAPEDTRTFVDGVEIPSLYHLGGLRSNLNTDLVEDLTFVPGGYGADYGRGLGGMVQVHTRELDAGDLADKGVHGYVGADLLDASSLLRAALTPKLHLAVSGRASYVDRLFAGVDDEAGDYFPLPRYWDSQAKLSYAMSSRRRLSATFLGAGDRLRRTVAALDPTQSKSEALRNVFYRGSLRYEQQLGGGQSVTVTPFFGYDQAGQQLRFAAVPAELEVRTWRYGLRAAYRTPLAAKLDLELGTDVLGSASAADRFGSLTLPHREGDLYVFGQPPGQEVNGDAWSTQILDVAAYATLQWRLGPLTFSPGLRLDAYALSASRALPTLGSVPPLGTTELAWAIDPRLLLRWRVLQRWTLKASAGLYHQPPNPAEMSAIFGNPTLGLAKAAHFIAGSELRLTDTLLLELTGFFKRFSNLVTRNAAATPQVAQALLQDGEGRSYGAQLLLRQELRKGWFGWIAYALSRSERRRRGEPSYRLFDFDQTHVLTLVSSYRWQRWTFGGRLRWATGFPRTPVVGAFFNSRDDRYEPVFGAQNSTRLPDFVQLDLRIERSFPWRHGEVSAYLEGLNLTNRGNAEELVYDDRYETSGYVRGLPVLGVAGVRMEF